ncbi:amidase family protein [Venturia nashicola]|uniref:Amidase family protein n=1 Tax=Venturia nashicola TaxID=86259 RepID=A0A4Z1PHI1_9PEZI|nr:amidase family protein [Venturia nashicola]
MGELSVDMRILAVDELTIDQVHTAYRSGTYTARHLTEAYFARIKALDQTGPRLNAITAVSSTALDEAAALDRYFESNSKFIGPLHGIPVIVKDQCDTKGLETAYGNIRCKHIPTEDATLVKRLKNAGAIVLAKSTMPDFAASYNSCSSVSGETLNPYDMTRETGGSSAGTGAAIAANYGLLGVGEDTGGSIRVPASFCNLVGLRPTVGMISRAGLSPLVKTQDTPGPMTRTVKDAAIMLDALVGFDENDLYTTAASIAGPPKGGSYASNLTEKTLAGARIGVLKSVFGDDNDPECGAVNKTIRAAFAKFTTGTTLVEIDDIPNLKHYLGFTSIYKSRSHFDIDNFLKAHPHLDLTLDELYESKSFHQSLSLWQDIASSKSNTHPYEDPDYVSRLDQREDFQRIVIGIMAKHNLDALAYPSVRIPPPTVKDVVGPRFNDEFPTNTVIGSQLRMPAISVPVGFTEAGSPHGGLPVGLELLGMPYREQLLLELAYGVEQLIKARRAPVF